MQLRNGLSGDQLRSLMMRYEYALGDGRPREIGELCREQGHFTRQQFLEICDWKTHRSRSRCLLNAEADIIRQTGIALKVSTIEKDRTAVLRRLHGVEWASASVILHFAHRDPYPILDFRALWSLGVDKRPNYISFDFWYEYVQICRALSQEVKISMRDLDRALWQFSKENQPIKL